MAQAKQGNTVKVHYTGKLDDSTVFDSSEGREPLEFTIGQGQVIPGFENAVVGLDIGDKTSVHIEPGDAYGERQENLVFVINRENLPQDLDPQMNQHFQMQHDSGREMVVTVTGMSEKDVTFDANHPLAGQALNFDIQLVGVA
jgi:peptidylprolyl isomerase